ncbi:MAG: imidazolonepropionase [candidate division Zixibacteria bacterium CG_4_9_14_3_um_filter_46_8]|nr:MAG: imidazolonepropionase [candidate division Zixibacteria bacterium CG_4_9_14_3_um_filter_46_8]
MGARFLIRNIGQLLTIRSSDTGPRIGKYLSELGIIEDAAILINGEKIAKVGKEKEVLKGLKRSSITDEIDAKRMMVSPGFVDPHTHPIFYGTREEEFCMRLAGMKYMEIAQAGGGIRNSARRFRNASKTEIKRQTKAVLKRLLRHGITTIEAKSGYGLSFESEVRALEIIRELNGQQPIDMVPTFLGAHEFPDEYRDKRDEYIRIIIEEMIPYVAKHNLAEFCDIFCEEGVFDIEQSRKILTAAKRHGLKIRMHADEIHPIGGAELAAEVEARTADHLVAASDEGIRLMAKAGVMPVLLPGTSFSLNTGKYARARDMIAAGLAICISTDCNPGSSYTESASMIISLACLHLKLTPEEAFVAYTLNPAYSLDRNHLYGSIETGKIADLIIWETPNYKEVPYHFGVNLVGKVIKRGKRVV